MFNIGDKVRIKSYDYILHHMHHCVAFIDELADKEGEIIDISILDFYDEKTTFYKVKTNIKVYNNDIYWCHSDWVIPIDTFNWEDI